MNDALARHSDPETSHVAAAECDAAGIEGRVLRHLKQRGPATIHTIAADTGISLVSVSPRIAQLRRKGLVVDSGECDRSQRMPRKIWRVA